MSSNSGSRKKMSQFLDPNTAGILQGPFYTEISPYLQILEDFFTKLKTDMEKGATHVTQGRKHFLENFGNSSRIKRKVLTQVKDLF